MTAATLRWTQQQYLRSDQHRLDWRVSPLLAPDLSGLPPAYVVTCGCDPLEDAGVAASHQHFPGQIHGFITLGRLIAQTAVLLAETACALDAAFQTGAPAPYGPQVRG